MQQHSRTSFGAAHVIDVLRGRSTEKMREHGHDRLSTWGIGKDLEDMQWRVVLRQLVARHVIWIDAERHNVLRLGELANAVLRDEMRIEVRRRLIQNPKAMASADAHERREKRDELLSQLSPVSRQIFEGLRKWRLETAKALGKPPYVLFWDKQLAEIARRKPVDLEELLMIPGVGRQKIERYADEILEIVESEL